MTDDIRKQRYHIKELEDGGSCSYAGPGRGDCEHFVGLPGKSIPGQHDGPDDTTDCYGKPNGWCWQCWKSYQIAALQARIKDLEGYSEIDHKTIHTQQQRIKEMEGALVKIAEQDDVNSIHYMTNSDSGSIAKQALKEKA